MDNIALPISVLIVVVLQTAGLAFFMGKLANRVTNEETNGKKTDTSFAEYKKDQKETVKRLHDKFDSCNSVKKNECSDQMSAAENRATQESTNQCALITAMGEKVVNLRVAIEGLAKTIEGLKKE